MPAPKGNKNALGSQTNGRPGKDREECLERLVAWAALPDSCTLLGFSEWLYDNYKEFACPDTMMRWAREDVVFRRGYVHIKNLIGKRREAMVTAGTLHKSAYDFTRQLYDTYGKAEYREQLEFEAALQAGQQAVDAATVANTVAVLDQISKAQKAKAQPTRKRASKSKRTD